MSKAIWAALRGSAGARVAVSLVATTLIAATLGGCETTAEKSARLEKVAKREAASQRAAVQAITVTRPSARVKVLSTTLLHTSEGTAAAVTLRNDSARAVRELPISITASAGGRVVFQNEVAGAERALLVVPSLPAHGTLTWVDDQLPASVAGATLGARVGEGPVVVGSLPMLTTSSAGLGEEAGSASGEVSNRSAVAQHKLVIFAVARRAGKVVAAGRAVVPDLAAGASARFQLFFIGSPQGAALELSAPATTFR